MDKSFLMATMATKIPEMMVPSFQQAIDNMPEEKLNALASVPLKSPMTTILLAWLLGGFGADRFYLDQTGLGVVKLLTGGGCGIWWLIDIFTSFNRAKQYNYNKLQMYLH